MTAYVALYRVSTQRQGASGLGLDSQKAMVRRHLKEADLLLAEFTEIQSGTGRKRRPEFEACLALCRLRRATLIVAKLDRLSRDAFTILGLYRSGIEFIIADNPNLNRLTIGILALIAEQEAVAISERTKAALAQAKARGTRLGVNGARLAKANRQASLAFAASTKATIKSIQDSGVSTVKGICEELNRRGTKGAKGGIWHINSTHRLLKRIEAM